MRNLLLVFLASVIILAITNLLGIVSYFCAVLGSSFALYSAITILTVTVSIGLYNHIDTIIKDIPESLRIEKDELYDKTIDSLTSLKKEILSNIPIVISVFVVYYFVTSADNLSCTTNNIAANINLLATITSSALFIYIVTDLLRAFLTANDFRSIIKKG